MIVQRIEVKKDSPQRHGEHREKDEKNKATTEAVRR
jgi:hypothetical protein